LDEKWPVVDFMDAKWLAEEFTLWDLPKCSRDAKFYRFDLWDKQRRLEKIRAENQKRWGPIRHAGGRYSKRRRV
jgi:hypothetical protein